LGVLVFLLLLVVNKPIDVFQKRNRRSVIPYIAGAFFLSLREVIPTFRVAFSIVIITHSNKTTKAK
jgi:hypothetical protein